MQGIRNTISSYKIHKFTSTIQKYYYINFQIFNIYLILAAKFFYHPLQELGFYHRLFIF